MKYPPTTRKARTAKRAWWALSYTTTAPTHTGRTPLTARTNSPTAPDSGELRQCESCPLNQFGSAPDGKGKACKNMHRIYLLREGEVLPLLLPLPPTSLKAFKDYLAKRIVLKGKRAWQVLTQITLKKEQNSGGITYASCVFTKLGDLTPAQAEQIKDTVDAVKQLAESVPLTAADEASGETSGETPTKEAVLDALPDDQDYPF